MASLCSRLVRGLIRKGRAYSEKRVLDMRKAVKEGKGDKEISEAYDAGSTHFKFITYYLVIPGCSLLVYNTFYLAHNQEEEDEPLDPEIEGINMIRKLEAVFINHVAFIGQYVRKSIWHCLQPYPWGNNTPLFKNLDMFGDEKRRAEIAEHGGHVHAH